MANWIRVNPTEGTGDENNIIVHVDEYNGRISRPYEIKGITIDNMYSDICTVIQDGRPEFIELNSEDLYNNTIGFEGGVISIPGQSNSSSIIFTEISENIFTNTSRILKVNNIVEPNWNGVDIGAITDDPGQSDKFNFNLEFTINKNDSHQVITRTFKLSGLESNTNLITITQDRKPIPETITVDTRSFTIDSNGGNVEITGTATLKTMKIVLDITTISDVTYTLHINNEPIADWNGTNNIKIPDKYIISAEGYNYKVTANIPNYSADINREHHFYLSNENGDKRTEKIVITQTAAARFITISTKDYNAAANGDSVVISGRSNARRLSISTSTPTISSVKYSIDIDSSWNGTSDTNIDSATGSNTYDFNITANIPKNSGYEERQHKFTVKTETTGIDSGIITITQAGQDKPEYFLGVTPRQITIPWEGTAQEITISTNDDWKSTIRID